MATTSMDRIVSLDIIRGIAVMGIFSVNIVGMAMIQDAYFYPPDYGFSTLGDKIMWALNFIVVDGRFRSLFSILFGASMTLVIERAIATARSGWRVHYARMVVLLLFGLAHYYLLWWGDILANYALVGMIAFIFYRLKPKWLLLLAALSLSAQYGPMLYFGGQQIAKYEAKRSPDASPEDKKKLEELMSQLTSSDEVIAKDKAEHKTIASHIEASTSEKAWKRPFMSVMGFGLETLGLMLIGMAGYKSGYLTGSWSRESYKKVATVLVGTSVVLYSYAAWLILKANFDPFTYYPWDQMYVAPMHALSALGYAALIILIFSKPSAIADRFAAVGRAAFTNYLGATIIGVLIFYDQFGGLYGDVSRGQAWLFVPFVWAIMLAWSKPWLDTYRYGPFEWAWRSLARWRIEPMRKVAAAPATA